VRHAGRLLAEALLQRRMADRPVVMWAHRALSWGFLGLAAGAAVLALDANVLQPLGWTVLRGAPYQAVQAFLDLAGLALVAGAAVALARRLRSGDLKPRGAGVTVVLAALLVVGLTGFLLEGLRMTLEPESWQRWALVGRGTGRLLEAAGLGARLDSGTWLTVYGVLWWSQVVLTAGLLAAVPFGHLRHIVTVPAHLATVPDRSPGVLEAPFDLREVLAGGEVDLRVGAATVADFEPWQRRALAACTDCGRCQEVCPASVTGTALSPRELVLDLRGAARRPRDSDATDLLESGAVSEEALWACTLCGACAEVCPVRVDPASYVTPLRRELVVRGRLDQRPTEVLTGLARASNPYGFPHAARERLAAELGVPTIAEAPKADWLYWMGCAATYDPRVRRVAEAMVTLLRRAGVSFAVLGGEERCTGDPARRLGEEGRFQELALANLATLERHGVRRILTHCAHCYHALSHEYRQLGGDFEVVHHTQLLARLVAEGRIRPGVEPSGTSPDAAPDTPSGPVTLHDACYVGRLHGHLQEPRTTLRAVLGTEIVEMPRHGLRSFCCGGGGAGYWQTVPRRESVGAVRVREAAATGATTVAVECPFCLRLLEDGARAEGNGLEVLDVAELVVRSLAAAAEDRAEGR
jgi:Fe-S oxidoreductase